MEPTCSLTYDEIAQALGLLPDSARRLVRRKRWQRRPGNDGRTRIEVPLDALASARPAADKPADGSPVGRADIPQDDPPVAAPVRPDDPQDDPQDVPADKLPDPLLVARLARLEVEIAGLRELIEAERARADEAGRRADETAADRDRWHAEATKPLLARLFRRRAA